MIKIVNRSKGFKAKRNEARGLSGSLIKKYERFVDLVVGKSISLYEEENNLSGSMFLGDNKSLKISINTGNDTIHFYVIDMSTRDLLDELFFEDVDLKKDLSSIKNEVQDLLAQHVVLEKKTTTPKRNERIARIKKIVARKQNEKICSVCKAKMNESDGDLPESASLLVSDDQGIYVPQAFASNYMDGGSYKDWHVSEEDFDILMEGPDAEFYWETWDDVLDHAWYMEKGVKHTLYQDGDLFAIPEGAWDDEEDED